ncbi:beta-N-acetylhexosaminidase [Lacihabitans lacunae]|uniref:beta-N-acetylhexosaminidase n=1 Tax=Lacihabitans lacunae TaxID=1028214 RepID=A0ABV7YXU1_9BACT
MQFTSKYLFLTFCLFASSVIFAQHNIIPTPVKYENTSGMFMLDNQTAIRVNTKDESVTKMAQGFVDFLSKAGTNVELLKNATDKVPSKVISLNLANAAISEIGTEGYTLEVNDKEITINANKPAGIFYGLQTLRQLLPANFESLDYPMGIGMIMGCKITDYPRFGWRGLMFDDSRHFFGVDAVKSYIDKMAQYKFNVFHWHLTDDEGWRIEIKSLPKLTEIGAWRVERNGKFGENRPYPKEGEKATYGGFYTQEQIKEVIKYAADRNIRIIPEIDIPGHSMAALAAYPELSTLKQPKFVNPGSKFAEWYGDGKFEMLIENTLNPADEAVYTFVDKVMTEVAALFPSEYIHMGGDECYHGFWEKDPSVQKFMQKNKIKDTHELQSYFVKRVEKIINSKGKKMIGWDEILEGGLADGAAVMSWRGMKGGIEAAKMGHQVVMSPTTFAYLDYTQGDKSVENPIYADLSLRKAYSFEPVPEGVDPKFILGGQGNLWTEVIPNIQFANYMTYPRAFAISESVWSPKESKNFENFISRTEQHFTRFDASKTNISKAIYDPIVIVTKDGEKLMVTLQSEISNAEIFYTIDNTYPVNYGTKYTNTFEVPEGELSLRTQLYRNGQPVGRLLQISREQLLQRIK